MNGCNAPGLLAALAYAADMNTDSCYYHSWRMALVAKRLASMIAPDCAQDVFYGALVQDLGGVGARNHIYRTPPTRTRLVDRCVANHPIVSSSILNWIPGMRSAAEYVRAHHTWWRGRRSSDGNYGASLVGSQILGLVDSASRAGCFASPGRMGDGLRSISWQVNRAWRLDVWQALLQSTRDGGFYRDLADAGQLPEMITGVVAEVGVPEGLASAKGVERVLHLFAMILDLKEPSTKGHSMRVAELAKGVAGKMGLRQEDRDLVRMAGLVHDCGKLGLPTSLLAKSGRYLENDISQIKPHASMTIRALTCIPQCEWLRGLAEVAGHDHERVDGRGYPDGLGGDRIPLLSRILAVVDAYDAMISPSDYRIITSKAALMRLREGAGTQFDSTIVEALSLMVSDSAYRAAA